MRCLKHAMTNARPSFARSRRSYPYSAICHILQRSKSRFFNSLPPSPGIDMFTKKLFVFITLISLLCCFALQQTIDPNLMDWSITSRFENRSLKTATRGVSCQGKWRGEPEKDELARFRASATNESIDLVIAHCLGSLSWITAWTGEFQVNSVTIYSRCNATPSVPALQSTRVLHIPNLGREAYVWLYHMLHLLPAPDDRVTMFLTDTHLSRPMAAGCRDMYLGAKSQLGFYCSFRPQTRRLWSPFHSNSFRDSEHSIWHESNSLARNTHKEIGDNYTSQTHDYKGFQDAPFSPDPSLTLAKWLNQMNISMWDHITPVCFGGSFATTVKGLSSISKTQAMKMLLSVSRGSNIIEAHFFERTIASLLTTKPNFATLKVIKDMSRNLCSSDCGGRSGLLFGCKNQFMLMNKSEKNIDRT